MKLKIGKSSLNVFFQGLLRYMAGTLIFVVFVCVCGHLVVCVCVCVLVDTV